MNIFDLAFAFIAVALAGYTVFSLVNYVRTF